MFVSLKNAVLKKLICAAVNMFINVYAAFAQESNPEFPGLSDVLAFIGAHGKALIHSKAMSGRP